jgi:3-(3-hydroxy-phenyl)propionate hydroxylase
MIPTRPRWEFMLLPGESGEHVLADSFIDALLKPWDCESAISIERRAVYRFHGLVAEQWRHGPVLLAGDAAHQMPPFAGQGMCSGIRDAVNLAWKLIAILKGQASDAILDSYQKEREPNVRTYVELAIGMGQLVCTLDQEMAAQRDAGMLAQRAAGGEGMKPPPMPPLEGVTMTGLPESGKRFFQPWAGQGDTRVGLEDVLGKGAWLICETGVPQSLPDLTCISLNDAKLKPFKATLQDWLSALQVTSVLVRPDRYVFGTGTDPQHLQDSWHAALSQ